MKRHSLHASGWWAALAVSLALTACGGGGDSPPPPTVIPENLAISAPAAAESGAAVKFSSAASAPAGLKYSWDFGDGGTSTEAAPSHSFAAGGEFEVLLKVSNEVGMTREVRSKLTITNLANVKGLVCSGADSTGWCWQNPRPTGNRVNAVFFLNASLGWRAGEAGEIFKTTDGGATWVKQNSGITTALQGIAFFDAQNGWAAGAFGAVLRTTDGGTTWKVDRLAEASPGFYDAGLITPIDASNVYIGRPVGAYGYGGVFVSGDAGASWRPVTPAPTVITASGVLWAMENNQLKRSVDAGKSFAKVLEVKPDAGFSYFDTMSLMARDELRATLLTAQSRYDWTSQRYVNKVSVIATLDGGTTWTVAESGDLSSYGSGLRLLSASADGKTLNAVANANVLLRSVDGGRTWSSGGVIDPQGYGLTIMAVGGDAFAALGYSGLYFSEDGGQTWPKLKLPVGIESYRLMGNALRRVDAQTLLLTDGAGNVHLSKDKGANWSQAMSVGTGSPEPTVAFRDARNGFMVDDKGRSFATQDGGVTWQARRSDFGNVKSLQFVSKQVGWLVGYDGRLYKSSDGGETWLTGPIAQGIYFSSVSFEDEKLAWARRSVPGASGFAVTEDGGQTWTDLKLPHAIVTLRLRGDTWAAFGSAGEILVSRDKGQSWKSVFTGTSAYLYAAAFSDAKTVWAVGHDGTVLRSDDAAASWTTLKPAGVNGLRDIKFANAKVGWIVGENGLILTTADGGKTWRPQASGTTGTLSTLMIVDASTAWVSGAGGVLLATGNGGN